MISSIRFSTLVAVLTMSATVNAQDFNEDATDVEAQYADLGWTLEDHQTRCIPLWSEEDRKDIVVEGPCAVAEFGEFAELDGFKFYYAIYNDDTRFLTRYWSEDGDIESQVQDIRNSEWLSTSNVLVLLREELNLPQQITVFHLRKTRTDTPISGEVFLSPELIQTDIGPVLFVEALACCSSANSFWSDEYWVWKDAEWVRIYPSSWIQDAYNNINLPDGFAIRGLYRVAQTLTTLTHSSRVYRPDDANCCPQGGNIRIHFQWRDEKLQASSFESEYYR